MDIVVKGRHTEVPERFRLHATDKLGRIERFDNKVIRLDVEISRERNPRLQNHSDRVELTCHSRGPVIRAEAAAPDPYAALDLAYDKLQMRLRRLADRRRVHHGRKRPDSIEVVAVTEVLVSGEELAHPRHLPASSNGAVADFDAAATEPVAAVGLLDDDALGGVDGDGPLVVREKVHQAEPMTLDQALLELELVGHDFYLFEDKETRQPSVVYRRRGYDYGVIRLQTAQ